LGAQEPPLDPAPRGLDLRELALEALRQSVLDGEILARSDGAGASHDVADACRETKICVSLGYTIRETVLKLTERYETPGTRRRRLVRSGRERTR
jgi:hypothetical protein